MNNRDDEIKLAEAISCMESLHGTLNDRDNDCLRIVLDAALASQAQQPTDISKQLREYAADSGYSHNDYADTMLAAASEIERLTTSQAQQESQWISVEERLPEENCHVLVACGGGNVATTFYAIDHSFFDHAHGYKLSRKVHGKYSKHFELARQYGYRITHWMDIPPAPEGE